MKLWEGDGSPGTVDAGRQYRWVVLWIGGSAAYAKPYAVEWGTNHIYAVPQMGGEVNGASISYSGAKMTITTDRYVTATKVQVADWE